MQWRTTRQQSDPVAKRQAMKYAEVSLFSGLRFRTRRRGLGGGLDDIGGGIRRILGGSIQSFIFLTCLMSSADGEKPSSGGARVPAWRQATPGSCPRRALQQWPEEKRRTHQSVPLVPAIADEDRCICTDFGTPTSAAWSQFEFHLD